MVIFNSYVYNKFPEGKRPILWVSSILLVVVDGFLNHPQFLSRGYLDEKSTTTGESKLTGGYIN